MKLKIYLAVLILVIATFQDANSSKILLLTPMGSKSHKIFFMGIVNALLDKGHHVTVVSAYANDKPVKNLRDVVISDAFTATAFLGNVFEEGGADNVVKDLMFQSAELCNKGLASKEVQDLKKEKYDVVMISMFFDYCYLSLIDHMQVPFIYISPAGLFGPFLSIAGQIDVPSIVPNKLLEAKFPLSFNQRFKTVLLNWMFDGFTYYYMHPRMHSMCKEEGLCRSDMPAFHEMDKNASLFIINEVRMLETPPRPMMQNVIYAGGAHIKPGKQLPQDLEEWAKSSGEAGFIYFSLGSAVNPEDMPEKYLKTFLKVFGNLKQKVLWKWNSGNMKDVPPNVRIEKWLPQRDILAHSKLRLFITHGGLLSTQESIYNGVPLLGMPVFADQFANMNEAKDDGYAKVLNWKDLTEESLRTTLISILDDKSLRITAKALSDRMKDALNDPAENAAFWVEYVIRHKGAPHLRSPVHQLSKIELYNLDVYATLVAIVLLCIYIDYKILKFLFSCCCKSSKRNNKKNNKKNKRD